MWGGFEAHLEENPFDRIVPMMRGSTESIQCFLQDPLFIFLESRFSNGRSYNCNLIIWKVIFAKRILEVTLLEYSFISH